MSPGLDQGPGPAPPQGHHQRPPLCCCHRGTCGPCSTSALKSFSRHRPEGPFGTVSSGCPRFWTPQLHTVRSPPGPPAEDSSALQRLSRWCLSPWAAVTYVLLGLPLECKPLENEDWACLRAPGTP